MSNPLSSLTANQLRNAADLKEKLDALNKELNSILGASAPVSAKAPKKSTMSAASRAKIAAAQKARWAKVKATKPAVKPAEPVAKAPIKKSKMSAAGKARLSALAKARWAKIKAAGKKSL